MKFLSVSILLLVLISQEIKAKSANFRFGHRKGGNLYVPANAKISKAVQTNVFEQKLDHFNPSDDSVWDQLYYTNLDVYSDKNGSTAFLMLGGEGPASPYWVSGGAMYETAKDVNAALFELEHRFYGQSRPTSDLSVENLRFLSSEQALADAAAFIDFAQAELLNGSDTKWVVFGGSYSGSLAAWMRLKYPHLVHGAVSTSGPILAQVDFTGYFQVVVESLKTHSDACANTIKDAYANIEELLQDAEGRSVLKDTFNLCESLDNYLNESNSLMNFQASLAYPLAGVVQYNKIAGSVDIDAVCDNLVDESIGNAMERLASTNQLIEGDSCLDYNYAEEIEWFKEESWDSEAADTYRPWTYQTCVEFGFFQTSSQEEHFFGNGFPVELSLNMCADIFGAKFTEKFVDSAIKFTNVMYGGLDPDVGNVVWVHGSIDPWHALGVIETVDPRAPAVYINGTAHCANMYGNVNPETNPDLYAAVQKIDDLIKSWLMQ